MLARLSHAQPLACSAGAFGDLPMASGGQPGNPTRQPGRIANTAVALAEAAIGCDNRELVAP
jgi:hypothetical protein